MEINLLRDCYLESCIDIALSKYIKASEIFDFPEALNSREVLKKKIEDLSKCHFGVVAVKENSVIGFMMGLPMEELFGKSDGIYIPLFAYGATEDEVNVCRLMYRKFSKLCVSHQLFSHAMTLYVSDKEILDGLVWDGFGYRCCDAIKKVETVEVEGEYETREVMFEETEQLFDLVNMHLEFLNSSPLFMYRHPDKNSRRLQEWMKKETNKVFGIFDKGKLVSYMKLTENGETFISEQKKMANICGAYTLGSYRNKGLATILVATLNNYCASKGYTHLGVDFETFNYLGSRFWLKYFNAYTISVVRRIDERSRIKF